MRLWLSLFLLLTWLPVCCGCQQIKATSDSTIPVTSLCEVLKSPARFEGKPIRVDVQIMSMKEGSSMSTPDCDRLGIALVTTLEKGSEGGIFGLRSELTQYQKSSKPVLAILDGVYLPDFLDEVRHRRYPVFKAYAARNVRRSSVPERR